MINKTLKLLHNLTEELFYLSDIIESVGKLRYRGVIYVVYICIAFRGFCGAHINIG